MQFNYISTPMDRSYFENAERNVYGSVPEPPVATIGEIGSSVPEISPEQNLLVTSKNIIRSGINKFELATSMGGPTNPVGAESYGKEARQALRELRKVTDTEFTSVHVPTQINGLSGYNPQSGRFDDSYRKTAVEEIDSAIRFAADVAGGGAIVVHQSEFERPVSEEKWAYEDLPDGKRRYKFMSNFEEPERHILRVVDERDGSIKGVAQKNRKIHRPIWKKAESSYVWVDPNNPNNRVNVNKGDYLDIDEKPTNDPLKRVPEYDYEKGVFKTEEYDWTKVEEETKRHNEKTGENLTPEVMYYRVQMENQIAQQRGMALYHSQSYEEYMKSREKVAKTLKFYEELQSRLTPEQIKEIMIREGDRYGGQLVPPDEHDPVSYLKERLSSIDKQLRHTHESAANYEAQAAAAIEDQKHIKSIQDYALSQTRRTVAEAGVSAYKEQRDNPNIHKDLFVSIENWDPNSYGSHPDELKNIIKIGREEMVNYMTEKTIDINGKKIENPYFQRGISKDEAKKLAEKHIKITLDTEHLNLWRKKFVPIQGETREQTNKRFQEWTIKEVDKLSKEGMIGHVHLVDGIEGSHRHLPMGQGEYDLKGIIKKLKDNGFKGTIISEGHSENRRFGSDRQHTSAWRHLGSSIYGAGIPNAPFSGMSNYFHGRNEPPMYIFGSYSPSNDWSLWSQVQLE
jgi:hypothetical protein